MRFAIDIHGRGRFRPRELRNERRRGKGLRSAALGADAQHERHRVKLGDPRARVDRRRDHDAPCDRLPVNRAPVLHEEEAPTRAARAKESGGIDGLVHATAPDPDRERDREPRPRDPTASPDRDRDRNPDRDPDCDPAAR